MATATAIQLPLLSNDGLSEHSHEVRLRALARLYERREAVDELIESLERYQQKQQAQSRRAPCVAINAAGR